MLTAGNIIAALIMVLITVSMSGFILALLVMLGYVEFRHEPLEHYCGNECQCDWYERNK